ncbi:hypothetical protein SLEP1_g23757 [Rubroshorea leprosula]|uniref:Uncharacterized protein n=1 Tax=Rubroshorea leprosula TaxID=152421 RepID=A0AAV5JKN1_9ROSI|nr:hypothetical protein SLEP1_g23757 [Rubroshorea leprosula]
MVCWSCRACNFVPAGELPDELLFMLVFVGQIFGAE